MSVLSIIHLESQFMLLHYYHLILFQHKKSNHSYKKKETNKKLQYKMSVALYNQKVSH